MKNELVAKAMTMNTPEIHMGDNTHSHDHETNPVSFNTIKISVKRDIKPMLERLAFWLIQISSLQIRICRIRMMKGHPCVSFNHSNQRCFSLYFVSSPF